MQSKAAAQFIREQLRDATDEQIDILGTARRKSNDRPAYPQPMLRRLKAAVVAAGYDAMGEEQDRIKRYVWAGMTKSNVSTNGKFLGGYVGTVTLRNASAKVLQSADLEAQGVFWSLIADSTLLVSDREVIQRSWKKAGLALPKAVS